MQNLSSDLILNFRKNKHRFIRYYIFEKYKTKACVQTDESIWDLVVKLVQVYDSESYTKNPEDKDADTTQ